jgi:error-prone DNA polymerase
MQSLLRTRPENMDDLTVQVALVRPGPIQGGAVHPYIDRRAKRRVDPSFPIEYDHPSLEEALEETFGVVVFQDQVLEVAMALAGFSIGEAEGLRRAMSRKRSLEALEAFRERFVEGSARNGVDAETANLVYDKLAAFSGFGFPKSHAAAFALLAYQSAWLRRYHPVEFLCALLNAQPMGFYPPASLVRDAQRRGATALPPDVNASDASCSVERPLTGSDTVNLIGSDPVKRIRGAVRIGVGYVQGVGEKEAEAVAAGRPYVDLRDLVQRAAVDRDVFQALVEAGACDCFDEPRRVLLWQLGFVPRQQAAGGGARQLALPLEPTAETPALPEQTAWERMLADYRGTGISVGVHPLELLRPHLPPETVTSVELPRHRDRSELTVAGMAVARQRPQTANGIVFILLEDEHGLVNLVVPPQVYESHRALVRGEPLLSARGRLEKVGRNINVVVSELESLGPLARELAGLPEVRSALPKAHHFGHR